MIASVGSLSPLPQDGAGIGFLHSVVLGLVEGLTEFLPISSTGHLILVNEIYGRSDPAFEVAIQAGAISAIVLLYWRRLLRAFLELRPAARADAPRRNLWYLIVVAALPASVVGLLFEKRIEALLFTPQVVAIALIAWGVVFLVVEAWWHRRGDRPGRDIDDMTLRDALWIGCWQTFALIPGTSRSGATIVGGMVTGFDRAPAAEFSFLVGLPILYGACLLKIVKDFERLTGPLLPDLLVASAVSFVTAALVVGAFVRFLRRHTFRPFAWYRIALGVVVLGSAS